MSAIKALLNTIDTLYPGMYDMLGEPAAAELAAMTSAIEAAREYIKSTEWAASDDYGAYCVGCGNQQHEGHKDNCEHLAALAALEAVK